MVAHVRGQDHHAGVGMQSTQFRRELERIRPRHLEIHQDDVRRKPRGLLKHAAAVGETAHHLEIRLGPEPHLQSLRKQSVIVDAQHPRASVA